MGRKIIKAAIILFIIAFAVLNVIAYNNAYHFTHFSEDVNKETVKPEELNIAEKVKVLFTGIRKRKPIIDTFPSRAYENIVIPSPKGNLSAWHIKGSQNKGTVILFHGYTSNKAGVLAEADGFNKLGYNTLLVDFRGHGESFGNTTTIGFYEVEDVASAFEFVSNETQKPIILHGISMGAVAILRAVSLNMVSPDAIIVGCPYGSMLHAAKNRFKIMGVPAFPSAHLLVFWGGIQNNFWAFSNNTIEYSKNISAPTLILYGDGDERATAKESIQIFNNLKGGKKLVRFKNAGHQSYCRQNPTQWKQAITDFISNIK